MSLRDDDVEFLRDLAASLPDEAVSDQDSYVPQLTVRVAQPAQEQLSELRAENRQYAQEARNYRARLDYNQQQLRVLGAKWQHAERTAFLLGWGALLGWSGLGALLMPTILRWLGR